MKTFKIFFLIAINTLTFFNIYSNTELSKKKSNFAIHNKVIDQRIKGYFNNDNLDDYIVRDSKNNKLYSIYINNGQGYAKKINFVITEDDFDTVENPMENLFISNPKRGEILIGATCCGSFKSTEMNYYKFFDEINNWILYKTSLSTIESDFIPKIELSFLDYSFSIDGKKLNNKEINDYESIKRKKENEDFFNNEFNKLKKATENNIISQINSNLSFDDLAELLNTLPINKNNINKYNDLAYYTGLSKDGKISSIFLLKNIIEYDSNRTVAYLNLGDAQWGFEQNENAKKSYLKYISLMKSQGKDLNKIPKRVYDRIK
ncbi:hypothetical protein [Flavobacterium daemonense]|uniref:hypothetical protein n=1 Tax=Flavobacterium daemonense TaxID=1393049 RepID=UPI0011848780|nr:hypothetical protein [Flavobacterium daemonense]KAF2333761.1 hypothetical protein FND99_09840 [Flavobacterium daemonense]